MMEIIKIQEKNGIETVNARDLHSFLESKQDFSEWVKNRIEKYCFIEDQDFTIILGKSTGGRPSKEYYLSIDMAKELSMVENNEKGRQARQYFIEVEKKSKQILSKPQSSLDVLAQVVKVLQDQEKKQIEQDLRLSAIESRLETSQKDFYTIAGYCSLRGLKIDVTKANMLGRRASKLSREYGYEIGFANDPRFGKVGTYHLDILSQVI